MKRLRLKRGHGFDDYLGLNRMLKPDKAKLLRVSGVFAGSLILIFCFQASRAAVFQSTQLQDPIKEGIGVGEILIGAATASDVEARYGMKYELSNKNDYSYRMDYTEAGLAFYYCKKDAKKRIFLVELHHGVTSTGIIIGKSTLKDVVALYGERSGGGDTISEYKGIQFYAEADPTSDGKDKAPKLDRKIVEIDIVAPDKSSNFCD